MSNTEKGVLIFNEWFDALCELPSVDFKKIMMAIYRFQIHGEPPPDFQGKTKVLAAIIFPQIKRRLELSEFGKRGSKKRCAESDFENLASSLPSSLPSSHPESHIENCPSAIEKNRIEKNSKEKNRIADSVRGGAWGRARGRGRTSASESESDESRNKWGEFFEEAVNHAMRQIGGDK